MHGAREQKGPFTPRAGLHFRQRHLGTPEAREKRGGEKRTPETLPETLPETIPTPDRSHRRAGSDGFGHPLSGSGPAPVGSARAGYGDVPGRQPQLGLGTSAIGEGTKAPVLTPTPGLAARVGRPWGRGVARAGGPGGPVESWAGDYLLCGGGARRVAGGDGGLRPAAGQRSPVGLSRGPPLGVSRSRPRVLPTAGAGLGVHGLLFVHLSLSCR